MGGIASLARIDHEQCGMVSRLSQICKLGIPSDWVRIGYFRSQTIGVPGGGTMLQNVRSVCVQKWGKFSRLVQSYAYRNA